MPRITIDGLRGEYPGPGRSPIPALQGVTLEIADGEFLGLIGPSGAGKTTLLRLIAGLERPTAGSIRFDGQPIDDLPPDQRDVALMFQSGALFPHLSVFDNLALGLRLRGVSASAIRDRVAAASGIIGLGRLLARKPGELSGGERQRVALGRALLRGARVLLLDEPFGNLDAPWRRQLRREVLALHERLHATTLCVTHDQDEGIAWGNRVAVLDAGRIQQVGLPETLLSQPATRFVAGFVGSPPMNLIPGTVRRGAASSWFRVADAPAGSGGLGCPVTDVGLSPALPGSDFRCVLGVRPECWILDDPAGAVSPAAWAGRVDSVESSPTRPGLHYGWVRLTESLTVCITLPATFPVRSGAAVWLRPDPGAVVLFDAETGRRIGGDAGVNRNSSFPPAKAALE